MTKLEQIRETAQCVVDAIASAMEMDVAFIDEAFNLVATSRTFLEKRGIRVNHDFVKGAIKKKVVILSNPGFNELCQGCPHQGNCPETAEIVRTIEYNNEIIGIIVMVAYTQAQKDRLLGNTAALLDFLGEMASLVSSEIRLVRLLAQEQIMKNQYDAVINFMDTGIIIVDPDGAIRQANQHAMETLRLPGTYAKTPLKNYLPTTDFSPIFKGEPLVRMASTPLLNPSAQCLLSGQPVMMDENVVSAVISIENIKKMHSVVYEYSERQVETTPDDIHGTSPTMLEQKKYAAKLAGTDSTVLILGESGTGKELFARAIHSAGKRSPFPFITINCAAIPETLLESELFGYEDGAFSGARKGGRPGKFEIAAGGTIFLDEIGDMPLHMQAKLLRVLQDKTVERVGGVNPITVDVRVIAATNRDLNTMQKQGLFREDLFFRLNVMPLTIPPLRDRKEDIPVLSRHFLNKYNRETGRGLQGFSKGAGLILISYAWPGNARELQNAIEYAVNMEKTDRILPESLPPAIVSARPRVSETTLTARLKNFEYQVIQEALANHPNTVQGKKEAAKELGISLPTLYRKLQSA